MPEFRFRAQAALDLRQRQEDDAASVLARAEAEFARIAASRSAAEAERQAAQGGRLAGQRAGIGAGALEWHWNWINGLAATVARLGTELDTQRQAVDAADRHWREARRRRLALERLRDRAARRHQATEQRAERHTIDELARLRFVLPDAAHGRDEP